MKAVAFWALGFLVASHVAMFAQSGRAAATVTAELECKLDSRRAKVGDRVVLRAGAAARATDGSVIPRGAKLLGRVTQVQGHDKNHVDAQVAVLIDHAQWKGVRSRAVHVVVESIEPLPDSPRAFAGNAPLVGGWGKPSQSPWSKTSPALSTTKSSSETPAPRVADRNGPPEAQIPEGTPGQAGIHQQMAEHVDISVEETFVGRATGIPGVFVSSDTTHASSGMIFANGKDLHLDYGMLFTLTVVGSEPGK